MAENDIHKQPLDQGINAASENPQLKITDSIAQNWLTTALWIKLTGGFLFFVTFLMCCNMLQLGNDDIDGFSFLFAVLLLIAAIFFWNAGKGIETGLKVKKTATVQAGFKMLLNTYQYLGAIAILLCILAAFLLIIVLNINFSDARF